VFASFVSGALALALAFGCSTTDSAAASGNKGQVCHPECGNGLVTTCLPLFSGGSQPQTAFCPYGCASDSEGECNAGPADGSAPSGCAASAATIQQGALLETGATGVAVTTFGTETWVVVATDAGSACASAGDSAVTTAVGTGAFLTLSFPSNFAGQVAIGPNVHARLSAWKNGSLIANDQGATSGNISVDLSQPHGGTMGSYDLTFAAGEERGTFVAPECDICTTVK